MEAVLESALTDLALEIPAAGSIPYEDEAHARVYIGDQRGGLDEVAETLLRTEVRHRADHRRLTRAARVGGFAFRKRAQVHALIDRSNPGAGDAVSPQLLSNALRDGHDAIDPPIIFKTGDQVFSQREIDAAKDDARLDLDKSGSEVSQKNRPRSVEGQYLGPHARQNPQHAGEGDRPDLALNGERMDGDAAFPCALLQERLWVAY